MEFHVLRGDSHFQISVSLLNLLKDLRFQQVVFFSQKKIISVKDHVVIPMIPQKKALPLNLANKRRLDALKQSRAMRESEELQKAQEIATKLKEVKIAVAVKTGSGGKLFGSVTSNHILEKLSESGFTMDKKHFVSFSPIKELGKQNVTLQLHKEVEAEVEVEVVSENPIEPTE